MSSYGCCLPLDCGAVFSLHLHIRHCTEARPVASWTVLEGLVVLRVRMMFALATLLPDQYGDWGSEMWRCVAVYIVVICCFKCVLIILLEQITFDKSNLHFPLTTQSKTLASERSWSTLNENMTYPGARSWVWNWESTTPSDQSPSGPTKSARHAEQLLLQESCLVLCAVSWRVVYPRRRTASLPWRS